MSRAEGLVGLMLGCGLALSSCSQTYGSPVINVSSSVSHRDYGNGRNSLFDYIVTNSSAPGDADDFLRRVEFNFGRDRGVMDESYLISPQGWTYTLGDNSLSFQTSDFNKLIKTGSSLNFGVYSTSNGSENGSVFAESVGNGKSDSGSVDAPWLVPEPVSGLVALAFVPFLVGRKKIVI